MGKTSVLVSVLLTLFFLFPDRIQRNSLNNREDVRKASVSETEENTPEKVFPEPTVLAFDSSHQTVEISFDFPEDTLTRFRVDETDGLDLLSSDVQEHSLLLSLVLLEKTGEVTFVAALTGDIIFREQLAFYLFRDNLYLSQVSKEDAFYQAMKEHSDELSEEEISEEYFSISHEGHIEDNYSSSPSAAKGYDGSSSEKASGGNTSVQGRLTWKTSDLEVHPLKDVHVLLYDKELGSFGILADETYTDEDGYFCFSFDNPDRFFDFENGGADPFIRICAESHSFYVRRDWIFNYLTIYDRCSNVVENVETGSTTTFNICLDYDEGNMANKAFSICEAMVEGQNFASANGALNLESLPYDLNVMFPFTMDSSFSYTFVGGIGKDNWNDWVTVIHEYGHYVENIAGTYGADLPEILLNNPEHYTNSDHFADKWSKKYAMELTWSESWATMFAMLVYQENSALSAISYTERILLEIEYANTFTTEKRSCFGEGIENCVIAYLQALYQEFGFPFLWETTLQPGIYTLTDYQKYLESKKCSYRDRYGKELEKLYIAPGQLQLTNVPSGTTPPCFSWNPNGSEAFPNNRFSLVFYNSLGEPAYEIPNIPLGDDKENMEYELTQTEWKEVSEAFLGQDHCRVGVQGYQSDKNVVSGPYSSASIALSLPQKVIEYPERMRYWENCGYLGAGEEAVFDLRVPVTASFVLQTFGTEDTVITLLDSEGNQLARDDDRGYGVNAYILTDLKAEVLYRIKVRLYRAYSSGHYRLSIVPTHQFPYQDGVTPFDHYEGIWEVNSYENYDLNCYFTRNQSSLVRYCPPSDGNYQIYVTGASDNYLYFIDPRSADPLSSSDYDDDSYGSLNPVVTKNLEAGKNYLFVIARFDNRSAFTDLDSGDDFTLSFRKQ